MNNRFKFRFWCTSENRFITDPVIHGDGKISVQSGICGRDYCHDVIIQEYTGLTDKNGKEIYEGDIIHLKFNDESANLVVKWDKYMGLEYHNGGWTSMVHVDTHGEVIGNIFEHKHLLEK